MPVPPPDTDRADRPGPSDDDPDHPSLVLDALGRLEQALHATLERIDEHLDHHGERVPSHE